MHRSRGNEPVVLVTHLAIALAEPAAKSRALKAPAQAETNIRQIASQHMSLITRPMILGHARTELEH